MSNYDRLVSELAPMRQKLLDHSIYKEVLTVERLRRLMETHVFAVWDFMVLGLPAQATTVQESNSKAVVKSAASAASLRRLRQQNSPQFR